VEKREFLSAVDRERERLKKLCSSEERMPLVRAAAEVLK